MLLTTLALLSPSAAKALECRDFEKMLDAYGSNNLEGFRTGLVDGDSQYYAPLEFEGEFTITNANEGLLFTDSEVVRMLTSTGDGCKAYMANRPRYSNYASTTRESNGVLPYVIQDIGRHGLQAVKDIVNDPDRQVDIIVKNNTLFMKDRNDDRFEVGIESALNSNGVEPLHDEKAKELAWAATGAAGGWPGEKIALGSFAEALVAHMNEESNALASDGGCYFRLDNDHPWRLSDDTCIKSALYNLFRSEGAGRCPKAATCMHVRERTEVNRGLWQATVVVGADFHEVRGLDCQQFTLEAAEESIGGCAWPRWIPHV